MPEWTRVNSLEELDQDEIGDKYFHDETVGYLAVRMAHTIIISANLTNADPNDVNCLERLHKKYSDADLLPKNGPPVVPAPNPIDDRILFHSSRDPPESWGAGPIGTPGMKK